MPKNITTITEDAPSKFILARLVRWIDPEAIISAEMGRRGAGYIASKLPALLRAANADLKVLALVDTDGPNVCPVELKARLLGGLDSHWLELRFAVAEVESWLLADHESLAPWMRIRPASIPDFPDMLRDPKLELRRVARSSQSSLFRNDLAGDLGTSRPGPLYNSMLEEFVLQR